MSGSPVVETRSAWAAVALGVGAIAVLLLIENLWARPLDRLLLHFPGIDKVLHALQSAVVFRILHLLLGRTAMSAGARVVVAAVGTIAFAGFDEVQQSRVPGRTVEFADIAASAAGVPLGLATLTVSCSVTTTQSLKTGMLVDEFLGRSATQSPNALVLIERDREVTYGALEHMAYQCAHLYRTCGVTRGDRVVVALDNCEEMAAAYFGAMKAGAVAVPLPAGPRSDRLPAALADCTPRVAIADAPTATALGPRGVFAGVPHVFVLSLSAPTAPFANFVASLAACPAEPVEASRSDADLAAIIYTSGPPASRAA